MQIQLNQTSPLAANAGNAFTQIVQVGGQTLAGQAAASSVATAYGSPAAGQVQSSTATTATNAGPFGWSWATWIFIAVFIWWLFD
jgi:hypothetical protein